MNHFNWDKSFTIDFDLKTGVSKSAETTRRYLSQMKDMYLSSDAALAILKESDPLIYEFHELGCPERPGDLAFGTTILYPGTVGDKCYMTKGHFHTVLETSEVYYTLSGSGYMVMENPEGDCIELPLKQGEAIYIPRRYAHRSVNTGDTPLIMFYTFAADAGHDYGTIETKGYHKLVLKKDGKITITDNPKWKE